MSQVNTGGATDGFDPALFPDMAAQQAAQEVWNQGSKEAASDNPVGTFIVNIDEAELGRSMSSNRLQIHYKVTIMSGQFQGKELNKYDGLETAQQSKISQQQLARLGVDVNNLDLGKLPAILLSLKDKKAKITTKVNGQFFNIYFQGLVTDMNAAMVQPGKAPQGANAPSNRPF